MKQHFSTLAVSTHGPRLHSITRDVDRALADSEVADGLLTCFVRHTSASLLIQENADPDVLHDLANFLNRLVSREETLYRHNAEGPDDMPSHIRSMLTHTSISIPVQGKRMTLGTWQGIYLFEHRDRPHRREIVIHIIGA